MTRRARQRDPIDDLKVALTVRLLAMPGGGCICELEIFDEHLSKCASCLALHTVRITATINQTITKLTGGSVEFLSDSDKPGHLH